MVTAIESRAGQTADIRPSEARFRDFSAESLAEAELQQLDSFHFDQASDRLETGQIQLGLDALIDHLRDARMTLGEREWRRYVELGRRHHVCRLIHQDPFTGRAFRKPRGYAGDAVMLDFIYGSEAYHGNGWDFGHEDCRSAVHSATPLGLDVMHYTIHAPAPAGVRDRAQLVARMIDDFARFSPTPPEVLSIAAGHLRESRYSQALAENRVAKWVAFDSDVESLREVKRCNPQANVDVVAGTIRQIIGGRPPFGKFDYCYSTGLCDYLQDKVAQRLIERTFAMVKPGGHLAVANFMPDIRDVGYMECFMGWDLIYRNHAQMVNLAMTLDQRQVRELRLVVEENQNVIFLVICKK